jgi:hypothetical protein
MMDATNSTPWNDINYIYWDWNSDSTYEVGGDRDTYKTYPATWSAGGEYYVTLLVVNTDVYPEDTDTDTSLVPFYIGQAILTASETTIRAGNSIDFDATFSLPSSLDQSYEWDWEYQGGAFNWSDDDGETTHLYNTPGTYYCYVRVKYDDNSDWKCTTYLQINVT